MAMSYYDKFWETGGEDSMGQSTPSPSNRVAPAVCQVETRQAGEFSPGYESEEKTSEPKGARWDGWAEDWP